jgi:hypothetical protein
MEARMFSSVALKGVAKVLSQPTFRTFDTFLSRKLADSTIGYSFFLLGNLRIKEAAAASGHAGNGKGSSFKNLGYATKEVPYDSKLVARIKELYLTKIEDPQFSQVKKGRNFDSPIVVSREIKSPIIAIPELAELIDKEVKATIENYYESYFGVGGVEAWRTYHIPESLRSQGEAYSNWWHFDSRPIDNTKLFVNLCDVNDDVGPFHMIPARRSRELVREGYTNRKVGLPVNEVKENKIIKANGPAGAALFCNTELCLHKAGVPSEGRYRDILQFRFLPSGTPLAPNWYKMPLMG